MICHWSPRSQRRNIFADGYNIFIMQQYNFTIDREKKLCISARYNEKYFYI